MYQLEHYTSRFFPLRRIAIDSPAGSAKDRLIAPSGWISGRTAMGNSWIGSPDERYVVQIAATESDLAGDGSAQRRELLASLRQRYGADAVVRQKATRLSSRRPARRPAARRPLSRGTSSASGRNAASLTCSSSTSSLRGAIGARRRPRT